MYGNNYDFGGMHLIWWLIWLVVLFWVFASPYKIPGQARKKDSPLYVLKMRFASGEITKEEYEERKKIIGG